MNLSRRHFVQASAALAAPAFIGQARAQALSLIHI